MEKICLGRCGMVEIVAPKENLRTFDTRMICVSCLASEQFPFPVMEEEKFDDGDLLGYYIYLPPYSEEDGYTYASGCIECSTWKKYCEEREKICSHISEKGLVYCATDNKLHTKEEVLEKEKGQSEPWGVFPHMRPIKSITYGE